MLSDCEIVCLWTLNFSLSKDIQFIYTEQEQEIPVVFVLSRFSFCGCFHEHNAENKAVVIY